MREEWLACLCTYMVPAGWNARCSTRADKLSVPVVKMLVDAGFTEICIGVESGSQQILDNIKKHSTVEINSKAIERCREHGINSKAFIMLGLPGESQETIRETHSWIIHNQPDSIGLYLFNPLPGCDIYSHPEKYDLQCERGNFQSRYYGGRREEMVSRVSTSKISADEITRWYHRFLLDFKGMIA